MGDFDGVEVRSLRRFNSRHGSQKALLNTAQSLVESNEELKGLDTALEGVANADQ